MPDHRGLLAALAAVALVGRAGDDLVHTLQVGGKFLPARMFAARLARRLVLRRLGLKRFARALRFHFMVRYARLQIQQLELQIAQRLRALAVARDALQPQAFFKHLDLDLGQSQNLILARQLFLEPLVLLNQLRLKLGDDLGQLRIRLRVERLGGVHDVLWITDIVVE
jgi:hypothetical protein